MKAIVEIASADGKRRLTVDSNLNGLFRFTEWIFTDGDEYYGPCWDMTHMSGLYSTVAEAEADARSTLPWLWDQISN
ncbi:MAG: hypothetical protein ACOYOJ_17375 [Alsobacter sp.]